MPRVHQISDRLTDFPQWPTMLSLTPLVVDWLDDLVLLSAQGSSGPGGTRQEVVAGLILDAPEEVGRLIELAVDLRSAAFGGLPLTSDPYRTPPRRRITFPLPSPVSLRLDRLVNRVRRESMPATRSALVVGLINELREGRTREEQQKELEKLIALARISDAQRAKLKGERRTTVLAADPPDSGRRSPT
jgi:hypothetical protein